jgi:serine/threonine-protein kinase RsbW
LPRCPPISTTFTLRLPGRTQYLSVARLALAGFAAQLSIPFDEVQDLKLAVTEACAHLIRTTAGDTDLQLTCTAREDLLEIQIQRALPSRVRYHQVKAALELPLMRFSFAGRDEPEIGVHLLRALMDDVEIRRDGDGGGVRLVMSKRLAGRVVP